MKSLASSLLCVCFVCTLLGARSKTDSADWDTTNPSQWTSDDVYRILNRSPWTQSVKITFSKKGDESLSNQPSNANAGNRNYGPGPGAAGGRRGYNRSGSYSSGQSAPAPSNPPVLPTEVTVQWQSALPVRIAAAKKAGESLEPASFKPLDEYVIAVIGLPSTAIGGRAASADTDPTINQEEQKRIEDHVRSAASIVRSGHEPLTATRVELDQGFDGRMLIHFPKRDPIVAGEKSVEFRLAGGHPSLKKKFELKQMEYQDKLQL